MPPGKRTRILVVDDHTIVRQGLRAILESEPDMDTERPITLTRGTNRLVGSATE